jgi:GNAT superfamily N-acetyltransferase
LFAPADPSSPPASDLIRAMVAEMEPLYGPIDMPGTPSASPEEMTLPRGTFLVGWIDGEAVCGGGVKRLHDDRVGEIKRMYVTPGARGGMGRWLLGALEDAARRLGLRSLRLDHGDKQPAAERLYTAAGYVEIPDYNGNPRATCWREKHLT